MPGAADMRIKHTLHYDAPPSGWSTYPRIFFSRKPAQLPEAGEVPRIEAQVKRCAVAPAHLARYRRVCGIAAAETLPITYPHVLAGPLHSALLAAKAFPVKALGLVHLRNRIEQRAPLPADFSGTVRAWVEGHRETARGQEFDLCSALMVADQAHWLETSTFLARRRGTREPGRTRSAADSAVGGTALAVRASTLRAPANIGRAYAAVSGDYNPIHLADLSAKLFGFKHAIAHGMWSLARCTAGLAPTCADGPCVLEAAFKLPVYLPAALTLQIWSLPDGQGFALKDALGAKPHLHGSLLRLAP
jgi:acyl dehydratase